MHGSLNSNSNTSLAGPTKTDTYERRPDHCSVLALTGVKRSTPGCRRPPLDWDPHPYRLVALGGTSRRSGAIVDGFQTAWSAVAYAAGQLGVAAKIFVPTVSSPAKIQRIREYGADLVVGGDRYPDALAASDAWVRQTGVLPVHAFESARDSPRTSHDRA